MKQGSKLAAILLLFAFCGLAQAHDETLGDSENPAFFMSDLSIEEIVHSDVDPWKGTLTVFVQNTSDTAWTDFHFSIFTADGQGSADNVYFEENAAIGMTGYTDPTHEIDWHDISADGDAIDLYFDSNPVQTGEIVSFTVYTNNETDNVNFGISFYPTVPEPATMILLGLGGLFASRKRK